MQSKKKLKNSMMLDAARKLGQVGYAAFSVRIKWNLEKQKKELEFPYKSWQKATTDAPLVENCYNGLAIVTGAASDVLAIDTDRLKPGEDDCVDGIAHFDRLVQQLGLPDGVVVAETGSGGRHYLFSYSKSLQAGLGADVTGKSKLVLQGVRATIDSRITNNCIVCAPTSYGTPEGPREYRWLTGHPPPTATLPAAPAWLVTDLSRCSKICHPGERYPFTRVQTTTNLI